MKLTKIHFDSFKSLIDESLKIEFNCTGIVGINESGKSNILQAIRVLQGNEMLNAKHTPKIKKELNPKLRFNFSLNSDEKDEISNSLESWLESNSLLEKSVNKFELDIQFCIEYDLESQREKRDFKIINFNIPNQKLLVLKKEYSLGDFKLLHENNFIPLNEAIVLDKSKIEDSQKNFNSLQKKFGNKIQEIQNLENKKKVLVNGKDKSTKILDESIKNELSNVNSTIESLLADKKKVENILEQFPIDKIKKELEKEIEFQKDQIVSLKKNIKQYEKQINSYKIKENLTPPEKAAFTKAKNNLDSTNKKLEKEEEQLEFNISKLDGLNIPLDKKYTNDFETLGFYFSKIIEEKLFDYLPKVVFWEHSSEYILKSKTPFKDILNKRDLNEISRPLLNVFRIGLNINSIEELKDKINLISNDEDERTRLNDQLNENLNLHIKNVWNDYDQDVKINLEEHQIRIQFFDPDFKRRSYFNMAEKSQGAQTFLSFLLTIGAEAAKGVLKNTILLLDEPEIHLHPSGVRYMLKELIKISQKNNIVLYATHSIFMIDQSNYARHIYLKKKNERTSINPSEINRIGFFMQEEVLYNALNFDLNNDLNTTNRYNFVFEGDGDVIIFKHFYETIINKDLRPFPIKNSNFYQGGKCSDIKKYLTKNPIQLGTKWIFLIDNDDPANQLKKFIEGKYKDYMNKDIFIFQYSNPDKESHSTELEDLLSNKIISNTYEESLEIHNLNEEKDKIKSFDFDKKPYEEYHKEILDILKPDEKSQFTKTFKTSLNKTVKDTLTEIQDEENFKESIPKFYDWAKGKIERINKSLN